MIEKTLAKRYAAALLALAETHEAVEAIEAQVLELKKIYHEQASLRLMLQHPRIPKSRKKHVLNELFMGKVHPLLVGFLEVLVDKGRIHFLPEIADAFDHLADVSKGVVRVQVRTFLPLDETQKTTLGNRLVRLVQRKIDMQVEQDRTLKGGVFVRVGDSVMDGTVAHRLKILRERLLGGYATNHL